MVRLYLVDHAGIILAISTLRRRLSAISEAHQAAQLSNPTVSPVVRFAWEGMAALMARRLGQRRRRSLRLSPPWSGIWGPRSSTPVTGPCC